MFRRARLLSSLGLYSSYIVGKLYRVIAGAPSFLRVGFLCIACPFGALQLMAASLLISIELAVALGTTALLAAILGRLFCGWGCPIGAAVSFTYRPAGRSIGSLWIPIAILSMLGSAFAGVPLFCVVCPVGFLYKAGIFLLYGSDLLVLSAVVVWGLLLTALSRRGISWCGYLCPVGLTLGLISPKPMVRIEANSRCTGCGICKALCPSKINIPSMKVADRIRCTLCLSCIDFCREGAVELKFHDVSLVKK